MTIKEHLTELAEKIRSDCGSIVGYHEVQQWPKGRLEELIGMGVLAKSMHAKHITCNECCDNEGECTGIEVTIEKIQETGETAGFFLCLKGGGLKKIPKQELQQWVLVTEKLEELGYRMHYDKQNAIELDLNTFNKGPSRRLLEDLVARPSGVDYNQQHHGKQQPDTLKQVLKRSVYSDVAQYICREKTKIYVKEIQLNAKNNT